MLPPEGSIYSAHYQDLYHDNRAREVGDIILIKIVEISSGAKEAHTKTNRDSKLTGGISALLGLENWFSSHNFCSFSNISIIFFEVYFLSEAMVSDK